MALAAPQGKKASWGLGRRSLGLTRVGWPLPRHPHWRVWLLQACDHCQWAQTRRAWVGDTGQGPCR